MPDIAALPIREAEANWQEIASKGYAVQTFASPSELDALKDLYAATIAQVPREFFLSIFLESIEAKRMIFEGVRSILHEKLTELVPCFRIVNASFVTKKASTEHGGVGLHHDTSLVDHSQHLGINIWVPLCDVDPSNGCLRMADYSHRFNPISFLPDGYHSGFEQELAPPYVTDIPMKAGEACVFDSRLMHASGQNRSDHERVAVLFSLVPKDEPIRLHFRNPNSPERLDAYYVDSEFFLRFNPRVYPDESLRASMTFLGSFEYTPRKLSMADFAELHPDIPWAPPDPPASEEIPLPTSLWKGLLASLRSRKSQPK